MDNCSCTVTLLWSNFWIPISIVWQNGELTGFLRAIFIYFLPQVVSVTSTVGTNAYLYRSIIQSKRQLENNLKLSGKDEHKIIRLHRLIHNLQMRLQSSLPVFVLGGVDCFLNLLRIVTFITISVHYPISSAAISHANFLQFLGNPLEYCQIISHSITYGVYQKTASKKLRKYYQRFQRLSPPCPSKVVTLHPQ